MFPSLGDAHIYLRTTTQSVYLSKSGYDFLLQVDPDFPSPGSVSLMAIEEGVDLSQLDRRLEQLKVHFPSLEDVPVSTFRKGSLEKWAFLFGCPAWRQGSMISPFIGRPGVVLGGSCSYGKDGLIDVLIQHSPQFSKLGEKAAEEALSAVYAEFALFKQHWDAGGEPLRKRKEILRRLAWVTGEA